MLSRGHDTSHMQGARPECVVWPRYDTRQRS